MTIGTTTTLNVIQASLRRINSYQSGETLAAIDQNDALDTLNDLLESLSTSEQYVFGVNENILSWTAGKRIYSIGNPTNLLLGSQPFTGTLTSGSPTITGVTNMPSNLVAGLTPAFTVGSGSILSDTQALIPANTTVLAFNAIAQTVTMSANAIGNSNGIDSISYTVPGDFPIVRPLRITTGYTRFNALDFTLDMAETQQQYNAILYKAQPGPWPTVAYYNYTFPYGTLEVYQTPGNSAEVHLFTQTLLGTLTLTQILVMPQGYARALKWLLARELWTEFMGGTPMPQQIRELATEATNFIKQLNARPQAVATYDGELVRGNRPDGGWVLHGGYR
jgi:hypothetical protein